MSYSDYGSYNWEKVNNEWLYRSEWEDRSLVAEQAPRIMESHTGLKLDAVKQSQINEADNPELPFYMTHTHHSIIGDKEGFTVVSYKGHPEVLLNHKPFDLFNSESFEADSDESPQFYAVHLGKSEVKLIQLRPRYWSVAYINNEGREYLSICGYGLGEHFWLDEGGNNTYSGGEKYPREKACLKLALTTLEIE